MQAREGKRQDNTRQHKTRRDSQDITSQDKTPLVNGRQDMIGKTRHDKTRLDNPQDKRQTGDDKPRNNKATLDNARQRQDNASDENVHALLPTQRTGGLRFYYGGRLGQQQYGESLVSHPFGGWDWGICQFMSSFISHATLANVWALWQASCSCDGSYTHNAIIL